MLLRIELSLKTWSLLGFALNVSCVEVDQLIAGNAEPFDFREERHAQQKRCETGVKMQLFRSE